MNLEGSNHLFEDDEALKTMSSSFTQGFSSPFLTLCRVFRASSVRPCRCEASNFEVESLERLIGEASFLPVFMLFGA